MTKEQKQSIKEIAAHYGIDAQKEIAVEECAELIVAIKKNDRKNFATGKEVANSLAEIGSEIADVMIMCEQLAYLYGIEEVVKEQIEYKISRQFERMEKGK